LSHHEAFFARLNVVMTRYGGNLG